MKSENLIRLSRLGLSSEQMSAVLEVLAAELAPMEVAVELLEDRRKRDRARKILGTSLEHVPQKIHGNSVETPLARVEDKPLPSLITEPSQQDTPHNPPSETSEASREAFDSLTKGWGRFWDVYPKRAGGRDKQNAFKAFRAASKRAPVETIIAGAERYAAHCNSSGKAGTEFIRQARTWLNANGWEEDYGGSKPPVQTIAVKPVFKDTPEWEALLREKGGRLAALPLRDPDTKQYLGEGAWKQSA